LKEKKLFLSASQIGRYKECGRYWMLDKREGLRRVQEDRDRALSVGSGIHEALEELHGPEGGGLSKALEVWNHTMTANREKDILVIAGQTVDLCQTDPYELAWGEGVIRAYDAYEKIRNDIPLGRIDAVERGFPADVEKFGEKRNQEEEELLTLGTVMDHKVIFAGRWDGDNDGSVVEHKTCANLSDIKPEDLVVDEQISGMCWAASKLWGKPVSSVVYNVIGKIKIKACPRGKFETPEQYAYRVATRIMESPGKYFERHHASRTQSFLKQWQADTLEVARAMLSGVCLPKNKASWRGPCRNCVFRPLCDTWDDKRKLSQVRGALFTTREERMKELNG
jgi:hypothetical protein